jgi:AraC-like DNA-binding protein
VQTDSSGDCFAINFDIEGNAEFSPMCYTPKNAHAFLKAFEKARMLWKNKIGNYRMRCISILYEILLMIQSECATEYVAKSTAALIEPAVQYIHSNYTDGELKISDLAQLCGISEDYFRKIFRKKYNVSPSGYISSLKIEYAKELLRSGLLSVSEIAELAGFGSVSYFSREFKKTVGISPSEYK